MYNKFYLVIILLVLALIGVAYLFYRKYKLTQLRLDYESNDLRTLANLPRSDREIAKEKEGMKKSKYAALTSELADRNSTEIN